MFIMWGEAKLRSFSDHWKSIFDLICERHMKSYCRKYWNSLFVDLCIKSFLQKFVNYYSSYRTITLLWTTWKCFYSNRMCFPVCQLIFLMVYNLRLAHQTLEPADILAIWQLYQKGPLHMVLIICIIKSM